MSCTSEYGPAFRARGFRLTSQRLTILHVLRHAPGHVFPAEVFAQARRDLPGLTEPTVYRTLEFLVRNGFVWRAPAENGHFAYELAAQAHHHLRCRNCGKVSDLNQAMIDRAYRGLELATGFSIDHEHVTLSGVCPRCRRAHGARLRA